jgi:phosphoribosyl 1,2-cyclic phosphodiesterase
MQFASLGSGSRGNATLIEAGSTLVMVDCGFSCREAERRMARLDRSPEQLSAILVTHEHGDHIRGVAVLARRYRLPVWLTRGTHLIMQDDDSLELYYIDGHNSRGLGELEVQPYTVPHDAREPCQFVFSNGARRFGMLTDTGSNSQAAGLLAEIDTSRLQHIVAAHLSEQNNQPDLAREALAGALDCTVDWVGVAGQDAGFDWRVID